MLGSARAWPPLTLGSMWGRGKHPPVHFTLGHACPQALSCQSSPYRASWLGLATLGILGTRPVPWKEPVVAWVPVCRTKVLVLLSSSPSMAHVACQLTFTVFWDMVRVEDKNLFHTGAWKLSDLPKVRQPRKDQIWNSDHSLKSFT